MKTYFITTGFFVAYKNTFDVKIYNIQHPSQEACPKDYTVDYFTKIVVQRRLNSKKKVENNLTTFIKNVKMGIVPSTVDSK